MERELWAVEPCEHDRRWSAHNGCPGGFQTFIDFDAIWDRFDTLANRRTEAGLTYDELKQVVLGGTE